MDSFLMYQSEISTDGQDLELDLKSLGYLTEENKRLTLGFEDSTRDDDGDTEEDELEIDVYKAAMRGHKKILNRPNLGMEHLSRKSVEDNNILHVAVLYRRQAFLRALLTKRKFVAMNKKLLCQRNSRGNTPIHLVAQVGDSNTVELMHGLYYYKKNKRVVAGDDNDNDDDHDHDADDGDDVKEERPWRAKNSEGDTALNVALLNGCYSVASYLVSRDPALARIVNNSREAPLHLAITHLTPSHCSLMTSELLEAARCVASWRDAKGLTPLHRLALSHDPSRLIQVTKKMIDVCPESALVCDAFGNSFLHLLMRNQNFFDVHSKDDIQGLIRLCEIRALINLQDQDGNTPLLLALKCDNIPMASSLLFECSADKYIANKDGVSAKSIIEQKGLFEEVEKPRIMDEDDISMANKGDVYSLLEAVIRRGFYGSQDSEGRNFLHLVMSKTAGHHNYSSLDYCEKFLKFINKALQFYSSLVYQTDGTGNTPLHILAQNNSLCNRLTDPASGVPSLLSKLLTDCAEAVTKIESNSVPTSAVVDNRDQQPWVMQNADDNTPLHEAILANNKVLVLELLSYSHKSATILNKNKETPLHLLAGTSISMEEFTVEEMMEMLKAYFKALILQDNDGLIPIMLRAIRANNVNMVVTLLCNFQEFSNTHGQTLWQIFLQNHQSDTFLDELLNKDAFIKMLEQKNKDDGNTPLHIAIQEKYFRFVRDLLETWGSERESSTQGNQWLMDLLKISNNLGQTSEDLLADFPSLSKELEEKLLTDRRMRGIRSSWRIPRTQLQNYMSSMNVIAALQTTITFTAAFTVPGGLNQDKGTPILIDDISFQVFMISDVIAMCLSMMVLICLLWMVATDKRKSVMIQDFALTLLLLSFVATILTFMAGIYAFIYPVKPWMAITTLVLCSMLMVFLPRRVLTNLLHMLHSNYINVRIVKKMLNPQPPRSVFDGVV